MLVRLRGAERLGMGKLAMTKVTPRFKPPKARHFIREWRKYRGYTLEQLADRVGVTHGALSQLERGLTNYTQPMLEALAGALSCEPADLIMRDPTSDIWSIYDTLKALPKNDREKVVAIIDVLKKTGT